MLGRSVERRLPYSAEQLFDLAADVERYPEFLRGWIDVRVRDRRAEGYCTDQVLGLGPARIRFASKTILDRPRRIDVSSDDPAFRKLSLSWRFEPGPDGSCDVSLAVDLQLRSRLLQAVLERVIPDSASETMRAFEARAERLYGPGRSGSRASPAV